MSFLLPLLFVAFMVAIAGAAFALMFKNISDITKMGMEPIKRPRFRHPELQEVEDGDELLVVKFKPEIDEAGTVDLHFTPDEEFNDKVKQSDNFLHQSLKNRIEEINDPWYDDEDDDDDGDVPALVTR